MSEPFVAEICIFAFNFAPKGWAQCNGQLMPISQNTALFSLLGTCYGGDGKSTFALPNLQGSAPLHQGVSDYGAEFFLGEQAGSQTVTLIQTEMPFHFHSPKASSEQGLWATPNGVAVFGASAPGRPDLYVQPPFDPNPPPSMSPYAVSVTGGSVPHNNMQPYLTFNFCIALQGIFPSRP